MASDKPFADKTSAADKAIGFDYQYYYFLYKLLKLGKNETVGLEVKDDVHSDLENNHQLLIQLKHTTQLCAKGKPKNLTTFDSDLWKTLSNWSKIISDKNSGRENKISQLEFIKKTEFMLVTNKSYTKQCKFFDIIQDTQSAKTNLESLKSKTTDQNIQKYIDDITGLEIDVLTSFLEKIRLELEIDKIIDICKEALIEHHIADKRVDQLFRDLDSQIRQDNFITIRAGKKIVISFDDFTKKYRRFFDIARSEDLIINKYHKSLPKSLEQQIFIKQLIDIGDIGLSDVEVIAQYTRFKLMVQSNLTRWLRDGDLTSEEVDSFNNEAKLRWQNKFRASYRRQSKTDLNLLALEIIDEMRLQRLEIDSQTVGTEFSNGEYYLLSDLPEIGWQKEWDSKYK
nr:ABC-three component system protein [uncultured Desulfobacter sp.]